MTTTVTACSLDCPDGCSVLIETSQDGHLLSLRGNPDHPFTRGFTCAKIRNIARRLRHPDRILHPMRRKDGTFHRVSWDEALDECAARISSLRDGPGRMLHIQGSGAQGLLKRACQSFFEQLGASGTCGSLCNGAGAEACRMDFGTVDHGDPADILNASGIVNWGRDLSRSSIHLRWLVGRAFKAGVPVVSIGIGAEANGSFSSHVVRVRPGTDRFLAAAVAILLWDRGKIDTEAPRFCENFESFRDCLKHWDVKDLLGKCGVARKDAAVLADCYCQRPAATLIGWGLQRYLHGGENVRFINALSAISGNMGERGGGSYYFTPPMRHFDLGSLPTAPAPRRFLNKAMLGSELAKADPAVEFVWINGTNIVNQAADSLGLVRALERVPFKVCVEAFPTDTARRCDLILPCSLVFETEDIVASFLHHCVNMALPALPAPGEARDDYSILRDLGGRLDPSVELPAPKKFMEAALSNSRVNLEELRSKGFIDLARRKPVFHGAVFARPGGKCLLPDRLHEEPPADSEFPLRLLSLVRREAIHSQMLPEEHPPIPSVWVGLECALPRGAVFGNAVWLVSSLGRLKVRLDLDDTLGPDMAVYRRGDWMAHGGGINQLVPEIMSKQGRAAAYYELRVRLEPME